MGERTDDGRFTIHPTNPSEHQRENQEKLYVLVQSCTNGVIFLSGIMDFSQCGIHKNTTCLNNRSSLFRITIRIRISFIAIVIEQGSLWVLSTNVFILNSNQMSIKQHRLNQCEGKNNYTKSFKKILVCFCPTKNQLEGVLFYFCQMPTKFWAKCGIIDLQA